MGQPFATVLFRVKSEVDCRKVVDLLITRSAWFEVDPLPDDEWAVETKPENAEVASHFGARIVRVRPCVGCS